MQDPAKPPTVLVLGGPNGAGKTTCASRVMDSALNIQNYINVDTIARGLAGFAPESVAGQAGRIAIAQMRQLSQQRADFAFETTLAGRSHAQFLRRLSNEGYHVVLFYVWLKSPDLAMRRVAERVARGGHSIPVADIRRRYGRSVSNLFDVYIPLVDTWKIFDNSSNEYVKMAQCDRNQHPQVFQETLYRDLQIARRPSSL